MALNKSTRECNDVSLRHPTELDSIDAVRKAIEESSNISQDGGSLLHSAVKKSAIDLLQQLLDKNVDVNYCNKFGYSALHLSAESAQSEFVSLLLKAGASVNLTTKLRWSPLHLAAWRGHDVIVKQLLNSGASLFLNAIRYTCVTQWCMASQPPRDDDVQNRIASCPDSAKCPMSMFARVPANASIFAVRLNEATNGNFMMSIGVCCGNSVRELCNGEEFSAKSMRLKDDRRTGETGSCFEEFLKPVQMAPRQLKTGDVIYCTLDIQVGSLVISVNEDEYFHYYQLPRASPNIELNFSDYLFGVRVAPGHSIEIIQVEVGRSPLLLSCEKGKYNTFKILLEATANYSNDELVKSLLLASKMDRHDMIELLLNKGLDINSFGISGVTAILNCCHYGTRNSFRYLLGRGASVEIATKCGTTPLSIAAALGHDDMVRELIIQGSNINLSNQSGCSPINHASAVGHKAIVELLILADADVNMPDLSKASPLHNAIVRKNYAVISVLVSAATICLNQTNKCGRTPLYEAAVNNNQLVVKMLIDAGADVNIQEQSGLSPLNICSFKGYSAIAHDLIEAGANINSNLHHGWTPVNQAVYGRYLSIARELISRGANLTLTTEAGFIPLTTAISKGFTELVEMLLAADAKLVHHVNKCLKNPLHYAVAGGNSHEDIIQLLLAAGARLDQPDIEGKTPLHIAVEKGHLCTVQLLCRSLIPVTDMHLIQLVTKWNLQIGESGSSKSILEFTENSQTCRCPWGATGSEVTAQLPSTISSLSVNIAGYRKPGLCIGLRSSSMIAVDNEGKAAYATWCLRDEPRKHLPSSAANQSASYFLSTNEKLSEALRPLKEGDNITFNFNMVAGYLDISINNGEFSYVFDSDELLQKLSLSPLTSLGDFCYFATLPFECKLTILLTPVNIQDKNGNTPLHIAAMEDCSEQMMLALIRAGADMQIVNNANITPFAAAIEHRLEKIIDLGIEALRQQRKLSELCPSKYYCALSSAVKTCQLNLVENLVVKGVCWTKSAERLKDDELAEFYRCLICQNNSVNALKCLEYQNYSMWITLLGLIDCDNIIKICLASYHSLVEAKDDRNRIISGLALPQYQYLFNSSSLLFGRYKLIDKMPEHISETCVVFKAFDEEMKDANGESVRVALKLVRHKSKFDRELSSRSDSHFSDQYVVQHLRHHKPSRVEDDDEMGCIDINEIVAAKTACHLKCMVENLYCLVMPLADRNLFVAIKQENFAGNEKNMPKVKLVFSELVHCVRHVHKQGFIHGDIKPLNCMRINESWKLIDLSGALRIDKDNINVEISTGYCPPESIIYSEISNSYCVRPSQGPKSVLALPSFDVWSLGCILYQLVHPQASPLFYGDQSDNILSSSQGVGDTLETLMNWTNEVKDMKLKPIKDKYASNLLSRMLCKDPTRRITLDKVLAHPFLTNKRVERLLGEECLYDVFISYRVAANKREADELYNVLTSKFQLRVFLDQVCLKYGERWKEGFLKGIVSSDVFVCLLSTDAINSATNDKHNFSKLTRDSECDNVLLELSLAVELEHLGYLKSIFPVLIGSTNPYDQYQCYSSPNLSSVTVVDKLEADLKICMDDQGLGSPFLSSHSAAEVLNKIMGFQGIFFNKIDDHNMLTSAEKIATIVLQDKSRERPTHFIENITQAAKLAKHWNSSRKIPELQSLSVFQEPRGHALSSHFNRLEEALPITSSTPLFLRRPDSFRSASGYVIDELQGGALREFCDQDGRKYYLYDTQVSDTPTQMELILTPTPRVDQQSAITSEKRIEER